MMLSFTQNRSHVAYRMTALMAAIVAIAVCCMAAHADVHWTAELTPSDIRAGEGGQIVVKAVLDAGSYIYSTSEAKGGPTATTIEVDGGTALTTAGEPIGPPVQASPDSVYHVPAERYYHSVNFGVGAALSDGVVGAQKATVKIK